MNALATTLYHREFTTPFLAAADLEHVEVGDGTVKLLTEHGAPRYRITHYNSDTDSWVGQCDEFCGQPVAKDIASLIMS